MRGFKITSGRSEETASTVKKSYDSQISNFLGQVGGPSGNFFMGRENPLDDLFVWGQKMWEDNRRLSRLSDEQAKTINELKTRNDQLKKHTELLGSKYQDAKRQYHDMQAHHENELTRLTMEHSGTINTINIEHTRKMENLAAEHSQTVQDLHMHLANEKADHDSTVKQLGVDRKKREEELIGQLLVNQKEDRTWPDDVLKKKHGDLQALIERVVSPSNKEFLVPRGQVLGSHLDPKNFLSRAGTGRSHLLLKSILWNICCEQFFSAPYGFGALGPGDEQKKDLMDLYFTWRKMFDGYTQRGLPDDQTFAIFQQDKTANSWRSATFECLNECVNMALMPTDEHTRRLDTPYLRQSAENINHTVNRIMDILREFASLSNSAIKTGTEDEIRKIASLALQIALQFGINPAQLRLSIPRHGEYVSIGTNFRECDNGVLNKGKDLEVDLVISPGLEKFGVGQYDTSSALAVVPCGIYSKRVKV